ncbi:MAG: 50S ribosomal protein L18 [Candidatus Altiarchaeota archaeon]|nr:50S ribosomal protein L18 [Candidatus Altiarchaeota archaeon]
MATGPTYRVGYRRKRDGQTNYKSRLKTLKSGLTRLVIRPSNKHIKAQLVSYEENGDLIVAAATSSELKKHGWAHATGNLPAAYLTGLLCGIRGKQKGVKDAILDFGMNTSVKGSRIYAALKGAVDGGLSISHDPKMLPDDGRLKGSHIASYKEKFKSMEADFSKTKTAIENDLKKKA